MQKLLTLLDEAEQLATQLITVQKAWLAFRDAEQKLIGLTNDPKYTGGGTMYLNIRVGAYSELVVKRTVDIFNYYEDLINPQ